MDTTTEGAIIVGVTGPQRETAALRFAADCARRDGGDVVLVHAHGTVFPPPPPSILIAEAEVAEVAGWVVKEVGEEFAEMTEGAVPFRTVAVAGRSSHALVEVSRGARMVVVQHRDSHWLGRLFVGSTANAAAAHCDCPVVSVPDGWEPSQAPGEVVVGVHANGVPRQVLEAGFDWAVRTGAPLRVVHAWRLDPAYDDIITARVASEWRAEQVQAIESAAIDLRRSHPTVPFEVEVRHHWPAQVLVDDSQVASMVVVGRHARHGKDTSHLGAVARVVLREAKSPVMVVPPADSAQDWGLDADEVSPQT